MFNLIKRDPLIINEVKQQTLRFLIVHNSLFISSD